MTAILTKSESMTNSAYGCRPEERKGSQRIQYGIINVNKPQGPTSHQVADYIKKMLNISKAGHSGTLDPNVTGVLPIALEKATRVVSVLLKSPKEYTALMHLHKKVPRQEMESVFNKCRGEISQVPPRKSAVRRQERKRVIYALELKEMQGQDVLFKVSCQAGTYIRTLIHHMGQLIGTGAHMAQLIRTKAGPFTHKTWHSLQDIRDAYEFCGQGKDAELERIVLPMEAAVVDLPRIWVHDSAISSVCHGSSLGIPGIARLTADIRQHDLIAVMSLKGELISIAKAVLSAGDIMQKERGLAAVTTAVFMDREVYPSFKKDK